MRSIDIHAPLVPQCLWKTVDAGQDWYGMRYEPGDGLGTLVQQGKRTTLASPKLRFTPEERLQDMDAQGVDVHVVSIHTPLFGYHLETSQGQQLARQVNDEIAEMTRQWPQRFAGLATLFPIEKPGKGAFYHTHLQEPLTALGITHLIFTGVTTEVCVQTTMREATDRGYEGLLVEDATASYFPAFKQTTLEMGRAQGAIVGWTPPADRVLHALAAHRR
jgi:nicotinamidase-related amidase